MKNQNGIQILDCTIRDGGYINNWWFDKNMVREVYRNLSKAGVDYIELGFRGSERYFDPQKFGLWRFSTENDLMEVSNGIEGAKISIMGDYGKLDLKDLCEQKDSVVTMVRVAVHKNQVFNALAQLEKIKAKGYISSLQAMGFTSYSEQEKSELKSALVDSGVDYFYIADSYGSIFPNQMAELFSPFQDIANIKLGFHPHNSLQMAFANTLEAIRIGVDIIDSSIFGMGRGSGNLPTEIILAYLEVQGSRKYNVIPVLSSIDRYFVDIMKETPWGYQLPFMISGIFKCHPYYATDLVNRKEYSMDDIWKALEVVEEMDPIGFDRTIVDTLIQKGVVGSLGKTAIAENTNRAPVNQRKDLPDVQYVNRHEGRDFLVLANGPNLKNYRDRIMAFIDKFDPIILGANYLSGLFEPHYHAFNNKKRFSMYVDSVNPDSKLLIGENISKAMISEYLKRDYETLCFEDVLDADFNIDEGRIVTNCRTISVLLIGVAAVMGAKRIFITGMDGYMDKNSVKNTLFYDEQFEPDEYEINMERHRWNEDFLHQINQYIENTGREGIHVITPTSHQSFYKGIENYLEE